MFSELSYILPFLLVSKLVNPWFAVLETLGTYDCKNDIIIISLDIFALNKVVFMK